MPVASSGYDRPARAVGKAVEGVTPTRFPSARPGVEADDGGYVRAGHGSTGWFIHDAGRPRAEDNCNQNCNCYAVVGVVGILAVAKHLDIRASEHVRRVVDPSRPTPCSRRGTSSDNQANAACTLSTSAALARARPASIGVASNRVSTRSLMGRASFGIEEQHVHRTAEGHDAAVLHLGEPSWRHCTTSRSTVLSVTRSVRSSYRPGFCTPATSDGPGPGSSCPRRCPARRRRRAPLEGRPQRPTPLSESENAVTASRHLRLRQAMLEPERSRSRTPGLR